jgi:hypothetical protein
MPSLVHALPPSVPSPETEFAIFKRKWHAALAPGRTLPPYEDVVLGSLGRLADHLVLVGGSPGAFRILRAGRVVRGCAGFRLPARRPVHALRRPATEKRQGTKSREMGRGSAAGLWGFGRELRCERFRSEGLKRLRVLNE